MLLSFLLCWQKYFLKIFPLWGCYGGWLGFVLKLCWNSNVKMATRYANVDTIITSSQKLKQLSANQILQLRNKTIWCQLQFNLGSTLHFLNTVLIFNHYIKAASSNISFRSYKWNKIKVYCFDARCFDQNLSQQHHYLLNSFSYVLPVTKTKNLFSVNVRMSAHWSAVSQFEAARSRADSLFTIHSLSTILKAKTFCTDIGKLLRANIYEIMCTTCILHMQPFDFCQYSQKAIFI